MLLLRKPEKQRIVATILARNEADIIGATIEHHLEQGVSAFLLTDNLSTDKTKEIAGRYKEVVEIFDSTDDTHNQTSHVTKMAKLACKLKPDWIVHLDADEHWAGLETLAFVKEPVVCSTKCYNHPPRRDLTQMSYYLDLDGIEEIEGMARDSKVLHRPDPDIEILHGNRGVKGIVPYLTDSIVRHHYPVRSPQQFETKVIQGYEAMARRKDHCDRWSRWYNLGSSGRRTLLETVIQSWEQMILTRKGFMANLSELLTFWCDAPLAKELLARASRATRHQFVRKYDLHRLIL